MFQLQPIVHVASVLTARVWDREAHQAVSEQSLNRFIFPVYDLQAAAIHPAAHIACVQPALQIYCQ